MDQLSRDRVLDFFQQLATMQSKEEIFYMCFKEMLALPYHIVFELCPIERHHQGPSADMIEVQLLEHLHCIAGCT